MKRLNVLIIAHEFSPSQGSECAVGWNIVTNLCKYHNLTVIYASTNQFRTSDYENSIKNYLSTGKAFKELTLIPIPQPKRINFLVKINSLIKPANSSIGFAPFYYVGYKTWQKEAYKEAQKIIIRKKIDIVHQLTSISFREPGFLWKLDIPFVWGPCSGLVKIPLSFYRNLTIAEVMFEMLRNLSNYLQSNFSYRIRQAIKKAAIIYTVTKDDYIYFNSKTNINIRMMLDVGSYSYPYSIQREKDDVHGPVKLLWVGRLVYTKALDLLLKSLSIDKNMNNQIELRIIGDGPLRSRYEDLVKELQIVNVIWMGNILHDEVFSLMQNSDILIHSSIKEATSAVILEALTFGLPVICHDAFGMSHAINETCGIKIPLESPNKSIVGFYKAINQCVQNRELIDKLKGGAFNRSKELSWKNMAGSIANDYNNIIKNSNEDLINK